MKTDWKALSDTYDIRWVFGQAYNWCDKSFCVSMYFMSLIQHFIACGEGLGIRRYMTASLPADHGTYKNGVGSWNCVFSDKCNNTMDHVVLWEQQRIQVGQVGTIQVFHRKMGIIHFYDSINISNSQMPENSKSAYLHSSLY